MALRYYVSSEEAPFFVNNKMGSSDRIPTSGTYKVGDFIISNTQADGIFGWVCTVAGTPGTWIEIGSGGGSNTKTLSLSSSTVVSSPVREVTIGIKDFNKNTDFLMVYKNSTYLTEGVDYDISSDSTKIVSRTGNWNADSLGDYRFSFVVIKEVEKVNPEAVVGTENIKDSVVTMSKLGEDVKSRLDGFDSQLEHNITGITELDNKINMLNKYLYDLSIAKQGDDCSEIIQKALDEFGCVELPVGKEITVANQINVSKSCLIKGNNSTIRYTGEGALFNYNRGDSFYAYDLNVYVYNTGGFLNMFAPIGSEHSTRIIIDNINVFGNKHETFGVIFGKSDFCTISNTKFWYLNKAVEILQGEHTSTQIVFENVGGSNCDTGISFSGCDKISFINVDFMMSNIGFKMGNQCQRVLFLNCHTEYCEYGYYIPSNYLNKYILFENCSVKLPRDDTKAGFYVGESQQWGVRDLRFINCGEESFGDSLVFDIRAPFSFVGKLPENYNFTKISGESLLNTKIDLSNKIVDVIYEIDFKSENFLSNGESTYTVDDIYGIYTLNNSKIYGLKNLTPGTYLFDFECYSSDNLHLYCQRDGGDFAEAFSSVKVYESPTKQTILANISDTDNYRIGIQNWDSTDKTMYIKKLTVSRIF